MELSGYESNFEFEKGVECITVTPDFYGRVDFAWFLFFQRILSAKNGAKYRVLFGEKLKSEQLTKIGDAQTEPYKPLFDVNNNFKRRSVIQI